LQRGSSLSTVLSQGSSVIFVTNKYVYNKLIVSSDFISVIKFTTIEKPADAWSFFPSVVFMTIVSLVASEKCDMTTAALSMAAFFFVGGWLKPTDIEKYVDIRLLMLMGTSLSFATAMTKTGLAQKIADSISKEIHSNLSALFLIYLVTLFITEIISNNAAAALMYPIAVKLADKLNISYKPFAMVVMQAASMAFMCPIGYPTHVMVWRPGNYKFLDFCKFGLIPNFIWCIVTCLLVPLVWPF
jgi:di/tricarboxylate transporter